MFATSLVAWSTRVLARISLAVGTATRNAKSVNTLSMFAAIVLSAVANAQSERGSVSETSVEAALPVAPASPEELVVWTLLQPSAESGVPDVAAVSARIAKGGPSAASPIVAILLGESAEPEVAYAVHPRAIEMRRKILVDALKLLTPHDAIDGVRSRITSKTSVDARLLAIQVLSEIGGVPAFDGAIGIAGALDPIQWERTFVQGAIENAFVELVGRNPRIARRLASSMQNSPSGLAQIEARALTKARAATALPALLSNLGRDGALDLCILEQLEKVGANCDPLADPEALKRLHAMLESPDHDVQRAALVAAARIGDTDSIPLMLSRLTSADTLTQASARWALETSSGEKKGLDAAAWNEWWAHEKAWAEEELPNLSEALQIRDAQMVKASIDAGLTHRAHRHAVASAIKPMLDAQDPSAQRLACEVLAQIGSPRALPWLIEKLESENEDVRKAAWNGLRTITKQDMPADGAAWRLALAP